jgi:hypothetical protein
MPSQVSGVKNQIIQQVSERFETDRFGVDTMQMKVEVPDAVFPSQVLGMYASHPRFTGMALSRRSGERTKPGFWTVSYTFEGFLFEAPEPVYELVANLDQDPIESHPDFTEFAGTPSDPQNGAIFVDPEAGTISRDDARGVFREFAAGSSKAGIESYLVPGAEWKETTFTTTRPTSLRDIGKTESPAGPSPSLSGRNWLAWSETYTRRGNIYQVTRTWKLSGRNGWDNDIY